MAQAQSEIRYLTPLSVDVKKKKYCRFKKSGIKYIDYKERAGSYPSPSYHRHFIEVPASCGSGCEACTPLGSSSLRNRFDEIINRGGIRYMEIILKENVIGLGYKDDIVTVKDGYGRNYLIPTGKAIIASESAKKVLAENLKQRAHKIAKIKAEAEELAAKLGAIEPLKITTKVSATGAIYGSVNSLHIAEALSKLGFEIDRKIIVLKDVKEVGSYTATVKLHKEVSVEIPFEVVAEEA